MLSSLDIRLRETIKEHVGSDTAFPKHCTVCTLGASYTGWIKISFTTCTRSFFLELYFETRYTYYGYYGSDPFSWQY